MTPDEIATLMNDTAGQRWGDEAHFQRFARLLLTAEREACAELVEGMGVQHPKYIAAAIRTRSNA
jgi:hypothetical protein